MPNLFSTFTRAALAAAGFALAAPAMAATATFDCQGGSLSWNAGTNTLTCVATSTKCVISGPTSGQTNGSVTLNATCPGTGNLAWTGGGGTASCTGTSCVVSASSDGNVQYTAARAADGSTVSDPHTVAWSTNVVAPGGCSLSASPSTGTAGSSTTLTASCSTGTTPITLAWTGSGTGNCPTSMSGTSTTCTVSDIQQTTTFGVNFSNSSGNNNKSASFTVSTGGGGGGGFASCGSGWSPVEEGWSSQHTVWFNQGSAYSFKLVVAADASTSAKTISFGSYGGGGSYEYAISTTACNFNSADMVPAVNSKGNVQSYKAYGTDGDGIFSTYYKVGANLQPGQTYFLNVRNTGCGGTCGEVIQNPEP